jgi:hypothetical protein
MQPRVVIAGRQECLRELAHAMLSVERTDVEQMDIGEHALARRRNLHVTSIPTHTRAFVTSRGNSRELCVNASTVAWAEPVPTAVGTERQA